jgi:hypothetical protein
MKIKLDENLPATLVAEVSFLRGTLVIATDHKIRIRAPHGMPDTAP